MLSFYRFPRRSSDDPGSPPPSAAQLAPAPISAPEPPAARIVVASQPTERELSLAAELQAVTGRLTTTEAEKRAREQRINELEDELNRLKKLATPTPPSAPSKKSNGWFFED